MVVFFFALAGGFGASYFLLSLVQRFTVPASSGGVNGPWVIRPILAVHLCASAFSAAMLLPLIMGPLGRKWRAADAAAGKPPAPGPSVTAKVSTYAAGGLLLVIYGAALVLYLFSWTVVGPDAIAEHLLGKVRKHSYAQVLTLETIPSGFRSDELAKNGPWDNIRFTDGSEADFSLENEGLTEADFRAVEAWIAARSGQVWQPRAGVRPRH